MQWDPDLYLEIHEQELERFLDQRALERAASEARRVARASAAASSGAAAGPALAAQPVPARRGPRPVRASFLTGVAVLARVLHLLH